jgi:hypothetical protein
MRERSKLLEHAGVNGKIFLAFQTNIPASATQVHDSQPGCVQELENGLRADAAAACAPPLNGRICTVITPAVAADPGEEAELPSHHLWPTDLLV